MQVSRVCEGFLRGMPADWSPAWPRAVDDPFQFFPIAFRQERADGEPSETAEQVGARLGLPGLRSFVVVHLPPAAQVPHGRVFEVRSGSGNLLFGLWDDDALAQRLGASFQQGYESARSGGLITPRSSRLDEEPRPHVRAFRVVDAKGSPQGSMAHFHLDDAVGSHALDTYLSCYALADREARTVFYQAARRSSYKPASILSPGDHVLDTLYGPSGVLLLWVTRNPGLPGLVFKDLQSRTVASLGLGPAVGGYGKERSLALELTEPVYPLGPIFLSIFRHLDQDLFGATRRAARPQVGPESTARDRESAKARVAARQAERTRPGPPPSA